MIKETSDPGAKVKENAFAKLVTSLLEREISERADPKLAQKRVLTGSPLEDLLQPRKRIRGQRVDGECCLILCSW